MARAERPRGLCPECEKDCAITEEGGVRHHFTDDPEKQAGSDSRRCKGVGQVPKKAVPGSMTFLCRVPAGPTGCGHPVHLTSNHRARSHLDLQNKPCAGGSDWPIALDPDGPRYDTAEWSEDDWTRALGDPHSHEADVAIAEVEHIQREQDTAYEGSFCAADGTEEPEPPEPGVNSWKTPADLLEQMPEGVRRLAESNPECWDCRHEVTPLVDRFGPDGKPEVIVWGCRVNCGHTGGHAGPCRPQHSTEDRLGNLLAGSYFRRHRVPRPLDSLVYRVETNSSAVDIVTAVIVSAGRHQGRVGELTDLSEEITCTDLNGTPRPRRDPGTGGTSPSSPSPQPLTPSRPVPTTAASSTTSTDPRSPRPSAATVMPTAAPKAARSSRATSSGPTGTMAGSTPNAPRTDVADAFTTAKQAASESDRYDRYGRYKLTHPATGKPVKWTRATTYAKSIADTYNLSMWSQRMVLKGASLRPDIVAAVSTLDVKEDRDRINGLVEDAKKAAGNKVAANLGTALHAFTEDRDLALVGQPVKAKAIPDNLRPSVDAYEALLREFGLVPVPGLIEFTTAVLQYEIAGTSDRCYKVTRDITFKLKNRTVTLYAGEYVIGDVKSGADLSYGWMEICIQLAIYAQGINASGVFDWNTGTWGRPVTPEDPSVQIKVRTDVGLIPHLPVDRKDGDPLATLFAVDLDWGWATAVLCGQVRTARKEGNLATALTVADVADGPAEALSTQSVLVRPATLEEKAQAVTTQAAASEVWKEAVAARTPKAEVDRLVGLMRAKLESLVEQGA